LIELLVVVAVVGLLASITLGYLSDAKKKGDDSAIKSNLATIRSVGEIFYTDNASSYLPASGATFPLDSVPPCPVYNATGTNMLSKSKIIADAVAEAVKRGTGSSCYNSVNFWAVAIGLKLVANTSWCVDSTGAAKIVNTVPSAAINSSSFDCN